MMKTKYFSQMQLHPAGFNDPITISEGDVIKMADVDKPLRVVSLSSSFEGSGQLYVKCREFTPVVPTEPIVDYVYSVDYFVNNLRHLYGSSQKTGHNPNLAFQRKKSHEA